MSKIQAKKQQLRESIATTKKKYTPQVLEIMSDEVWAIVEIITLFQEAKTVFVYNSMNDEVATTNFMTKWQDQKDFYVPVVVENELVFRKMDNNTKFKESSFGIQEPLGENYTDLEAIDLVLVPGVAFDRQMNRMGRGKGYYDRFLSKIKAPKMGICFDFQLTDDVPSDVDDVPMDYIISENELIWKPKK